MPPTECIGHAPTQLQSSIRPHSLHLALIQHGTGWDTPPTATYHAALDTSPTLNTLSVLFDTDTYTCVPSGLYMSVPGWVWVVASRETSEVGMSVDPPLAG